MSKMDELVIRVNHTVIRARNSRRHFDLRPANANLFMMMLNDVPHVLGNVDLSKPRSKQCWEVRVAVNGEFDWAKPTETYELDRLEMIVDHILAGKFLPSEV